MWLLLRAWFESKPVLRALCQLVVLGWMLSAIGYVLVLAVFLAPSKFAWATPLFFNLPVLALAFALIAAIGISHLLLYLPTCVRCTKRLFTDGPRTLLWRLSPDIRHHRAKTFMNSYRMGAIAELARTGNVSCSWCGHELGTKPDYVVSAP